ncbi:MAG TPA: hypothetical protein PKK12_06840, partial [Candidatus Aminicenantes bacterium]|nr:hypothetical protein [Candidatus Aminicenantes bacterium]
LKKENSYLAFMLVGVGLVYFSLFPVCYNYDGTVFAQFLRYALLRHDVLAVTQLHHLFYFPLAYGSYRGLEALTGYHVLEYFHLQLLSLFFALGSFWLVHRMLKRLVADPVVRLLGVLWVAGLFQFWLMGVESEVHMAAFFFATACVHRLGFAGERRLDPLLAGACAALAAGFHLAQGLLVLVGLVWLCWKRKGWRLVLSFLLGFGLILVPAFLLVAWRQGLPILQWLHAIVSPSASLGGTEAIPWSSPSLAALKTSLEASAASLVTAPTPGWAELAWLVLGFLVVLALRGSRRSGPPWLTGLLALWLTPFFVFFTLNNTGVGEFKLPVIVPLVLAALAGVAALRRGLARAVALTGAAGLLLVNGFVGIAPLTRWQNNLDWQRAQAIEAATPPGSVVVISGSFRGYGMGKIYIPYFSLRKAIILDWRIRDRSLEPARAEIARELAAGHPVFFHSDTAEGSPAMAEVRAKHGLSAAEVLHFLAEWSLGPLIPLPGGHALRQVRQGGLAGFRNAPTAGQRAGVASSRSMS